ncbi:circumsporozoite protein [Impatiens glandulifera]|uniref:circumsporozoite protein n=1 Tax=Impatiens glandulifera TaxID=253017 RepID=UPI001FB06BFE|nr:circumsporozoite protein [Impatiens glandulifera]
MASQRDINARADEILHQHDQEQSLSQGGHAQAVRPASQDLSSQDSDQQSYLSKTGESLKNAAGGAVNLAQGAAAGAVNLAQGAAASVKNTLGVNSESNNPSANTAATAANHPSGNNAAAAAAAANHPSGNSAAAAAAAAAANHPSGYTAAGANHPNNPSNRF